MTSSLESWRGVSSSGGSDQRSRGTMRVERRGEEPRFVDIRESRRLEPLPNVEGRVTENAADAVESSIGNGPSERRLNWGCGDWVVPGWVNSDRKEALGVVSGESARGLPLRMGRSITLSVSMRCLSSRLPDLVPALRRAAAGGAPRMAFSDSACQIWDKAIEAYRSRDSKYFLVGDAGGADAEREVGHTAALVRVLAQTFSRLSSLADLHRARQVSET